MTKGFGPGVNGPLLITSKFKSAEEAKKVLPALQKGIDGTADVAAVSEPTLDKTGTVAVFTAISKSAPWADETVSLVEDLRETTIPAAVKGPEPTPTSAARPPATSTWRRRSRTSCR